MKKLLFAIMLIVSAGGYALADTDPPLPSDSRIKLVKYNEEDVYTITTKYGYQTNIVFGQGEEIQTISVGDRSLWQLIPSSNRLFIRPMVDGAETNMTLLTNKHSYQFDLKSLAEGKTGDNIYVARFIYPDDKPKAGQGNSNWSAPTLPQAAAQAALSRPEPAWSTPAQPAPAPTPAPSAAPVQRAPAVIQPAPPVQTAPAVSAPVVHPNYNYTYAGPDAAAPVQTYDNGKSTFIQYRDNQPLPSVYVVDAGGNAKSVSYYIKGGLIVVDLVAEEWRLESDNGTVYLYNEMLNSK